MSKRKHKCKEEWESDLELTLKVMKEMDKIFPGKKNGGFHSTKCPKCGGILIMHKSDYNGHIHGNCKTDKCLSWKI